MSDTRENGRDPAEDSAAAFETDRVAQANERAAAAREPQAAHRVETLGPSDESAVQHTTAPWYLDEGGNIRDPGTDVIIASVVNPGGLIPDDEQMANGRLIERAPLLHAAASRALDYLTDHGIDLEGPEEELVAGIRYDLDEALGNTTHRPGELRSQKIHAPEPAATEPERGADRRSLPPDPEGMNDDRAEWAHAAIRHFQTQTGSAWEDALSDLLGDLMHFADRQGFDFGAELDRARDHYGAETLPLPDFEETRTPARPRTPLHDLQDTIAAQIDAAQRVVDNWSSGDLAGAVNDLEEVTEAARTTLRASSLEPVVPTMQQSDLFALTAPEERARSPWGRPLVETRAEVEERHRDEFELVLGAYGVEELPSQLEARHEAERTSLELREREANGFTLDDATGNPWAVVDRPIPSALSDELLRQARLTVTRCVETAGQDMLGPPFAVFPVEHIEDRFNAATARLAELNAIAFAREEAAKPITLEAIAIDPWNAVVRNLPRDAPHELFSAVAEAAGSLYVTPESEQRRPAWLSDMDPAEIGDMLKSRWKDAVQAADEVRVREAWQAPAFSYDTFAADMWTAVYLPVPKNADPNLLAESRRLAEVCRDLMIDQGPDYGPLSQRVQLDDGPDKFVERANERMAELDKLLLSRPAPDLQGPDLPFVERASPKPDGATAMRTGSDNPVVHEAWRAAAFSHETMIADPWTAAYLPIPENAGVELLHEARAMVRELQLATDGRDHDGPWLDDLRPGPMVDRERFSREANYEAATARRGELSERLELAIAAEAERQPGLSLEDLDFPRSEIETRAPRDGGMLSADFAASRLADHAARVMDLVLQTLTGFFVPEPVLTPPQIHDLTRANAERDEQRAVEVAARQQDADLVATNWTINHNRSPVHSGAGDEVRRGESIYDLYPGLTRHDEGAERAAESERAFYDTGIERKR